MREFITYTVIVFLTIGCNEIPENVNLIQKNDSLYTVKINEYINKNDTVYPMKLEISTPQYEKITLDSVSAKSIYLIMDSIDWNQFHSVTLYKSKNEWMDVVGNRSDGISCAYEFNNKVYFPENAPTSIDQMTFILISYLHQDGKYKKQKLFFK